MIALEEAAVVFTALACMAEREALIARVRIDLDAIVVEYSLW